jgi:Tol biopolymer transport system component
VTAEPSTQLSRALAGRYDISREIGRGGMATVYLARDVKHSRSVALKVLDPELGAVLGAERFLAEIRVTANLQHPNLLPLFDSGEADGLLFYVMPFVEGESLRARLDREKQLPVDEAVRIASAVAAALDYAHSNGVIHRDLKPENILLQHGQPVVADFGIALAVSNAGGQRVTQTGLSLGTPQYMSPEQATGDRAIDGRTDIYSLGAVTYEMLAGEPPHAGGTAQAVIAKLMTEEPRPLTVLRRSVPPHVDAAVRRALQKLPADRFGSAAQFADAIEGRSPVGASYDTGVSSPKAMKRRVAAWLAIAAGGVLLGVGIARAWRAPATTHDSVHFVVEPPAGLSLTVPGVQNIFALSGDGRTIAFSTGPRGAIYVRPLDRIESVLVPGVERPRSIALSEDGRAMLYMATSTLNSTRLLGDAPSVPIVLADTGIDANTWSSWMHGPNVVYVTNDTSVSKVWIAQGAGGPRRLVASLPRAEGRWTAPFLFPDGKTISLLTSSPSAGRASLSVTVVSTDGGGPTKLDLPAANVVGYANGLLFFGDENGRVLGAPFDLAHRRVRGEPTVLVENVEYGVTGVEAALGANGTFAYVSAATASRVDMVDEHGALVSTLPLEVHHYRNLEWSPDGRRLLLGASLNRAADLFVYDLESHVTSRLAGTSGAQGGSWTPDGKHIVFLGSTSNSVRGFMPVMMAADGSAPPQPIDGADGLGSFRISSDGRYLVGFVMSGASPWAAIPLQGGPRIQLLAGEKQPGEPEISPDGHWMAFLSRQTGRAEVFVRPFPSGPGQLQVSSTGASGVTWSRDGRQIFYRGYDAFRRATLDFSGPTPRLARIDSLFSDAGATSWAISPDGKRIVVLHDAEGSRKLVVVTNWLDEISSKLRGK